MASPKDTSLLAAYLVDGEDHLKRDTVLRRLRERLERTCDLSFNSDAFDGAAAEGDAIVGACRTIPFASEKRLVTVTSAERLSKKAQTAVVEYLKDPSDATVLVLVSDKLAKGSAFYKSVSALGRSAVIDCTPPKRRDLAEHVRAMAPSHGVTMTPKAAQALVDLVGEDTIHLDAELEKLSLAHFTDDAIDEEQVRSMVSRVAEVKPWEFVDAFAARNLKESMRLLGLMPSASPHALLRQCVGRIREIMCAHSVLEAGGSASSVAEALRMPEWKVKGHLRWAKGWSSKELRGALESSMEAERKMKGGFDAEAAFADWVIDVVGRPSRSAMR